MSSILIIEPTSKDSTKTVSLIIITSELSSVICNFERLGRISIILSELVAITISEYKVVSILTFSPIHAFKSVAVTPRVCV